MAHRAGVSTSITISITVIHKLMLGILLLGSTTAASIPMTNFVQCQHIAVFMSVVAGTGFCNSLIDRIRNGIGCCAASGLLDLISANGANLRGLCCGGCAGYMGSIVQFRIALGTGLPVSGLIADPSATGNMDIFPGITAVVTICITDIGITVGIVILAGITTAARIPMSGFVYRQLSSISPS